MSLADDLEAASKRILPGPTCGIDRFLQWLPSDAERAQWVDILARRSIHTSTIVDHVVRTLKYGGNFSIGIVDHHRTRKCRCWRTS